MLLKLILLLCILIIIAPKRKESMSDLDLNLNQQAGFDKVGQTIKEYTNEQYEKYGSRTMFNGKKIAVADDFFKAYKYASIKMCKKYNYVSTPQDDGSSTCVHTKETCLQDSNPSSSMWDQTYLEWRGNDTDENMCVYGIPEYKNMCTHEGLTYDEATGKCSTNKDYCSCKGVYWRSNDCYKDPLARGFEAGGFGKTLTQGTNTVAMGQCAASKI